MIRAVVSLAILGACYASVSQFTWNDCGTDPNRAIKISSVQVSPMPIVMPGPVTFSFNATQTSVLDGGKIELDLRRHVVILGFVHVPCILGVGSCSQTYCNAVSNMVHSSDAPTKKVGTQLQAILDKFNIKATCPIQPQSASVKSATIDIPDPGSVASILAAGDYIIKATLKDRNNVVQGCINFKIELKRKHSGFLFG